MSTSDRNLISLTQEHEVRYEAKKTGAGADEVKQAVKSEGNGRKKVEDTLGESK